MTKSDAEVKFDFAAGLKELEEITAWFESDNLDLDQGLAKFERGMELIARLKKYLGTVENQVEEIKRRFRATETTPNTAANQESQEDQGDIEPELFSR